MTIKVRLLYRWMPADGQMPAHLAFRDASEHVCDPRDDPDIAAQLAAHDAALRAAHEAIAETLRKKVEALEAGMPDFERAAAERDRVSAEHREAGERVIAGAAARIRAESAGMHLIEALPDEVEFDHIPGEAELDAAFPGRRRSLTAM